MDPPVISASTLEAGFLCGNKARLAKIDARSGLEASLTDSESLGVGP